MRRTTIAGITALCAGSLFAVVGVPSANAAPTPAAVSAAPSAVPAETVTTLPLFGVPLTVDVSSGPGGALTAVTVNPADGFTATKVKPNKVRFVNDAGTARVEVVSKHGSERVTVRAGQLTDLVGPGTWTGDVFGTGAMTTVNYEIVAAADGSPDITNVSTSDATAQVGDVSHRGHDGRQGASVRILFTNGIEARTLSIGVAIGSHFDESVAKLSVSLSKTFGQKLPSDQVVGAQTWNGVLCDGTAATINYTVNADGTISGATATPAATVNAGDHRLDVKFSDHERVRIRLRSSDDAGQMRVSVDERIRCDAADPTVNTPTSTTEPGDDNGDDHGDHNGGDHSGGDHSGDDHGGHGGDDSGSDDNGGNRASNGG